MIPSIVYIQLQTGRHTERELRIKAIDRYLKGESPKSIYTNVNRSKNWFFKWLKRYHSGKPGWYKERSTAPLRRPTRLSEIERKRIISIRQRLESEKFAPVGASAIKWELLRSGNRLRSDSTINRVLRREGIVKKTSGKRREWSSKKYHSRKEIKMKEIKVLLVDDEEEFVESLSERIKMRNLDSDIALNGEEALRIVDKEVPDVMVLDLKMPGIDGMEVLRRVKKAYPKVQVIMLSGHGSEKDEKEARRLGAFEYLEKPTSIDTLIKHIKRAFKHFDKSMTAATFAQAGDHKSAKEMMEREENVNNPGFSSNIPTV